MRTCLEVVAQRVQKKTSSYYTIRSLVNVRLSITTFLDETTGRQKKREGRDGRLGLIWFLGTSSG